jgi:hypothetical protein
MQIRATIAAAFGLLSALASAQQPKPVGLSLLFQNGAAKAITFYGNPARFVNEVDFVFTSAAQSGDRGIEPLKTLNETSKLDWNGVKMVDEDWRATGATFKRQRFYRNANWMNNASQFTLYPVNGAGKRIGTPLKADAGRDDRAGTGDLFVRRFVARQIAEGCKGHGDCQGAQFVSQALVQLRIHKNPGAAAVVFPAETSGLELEWTQNPGAVYKVAVRHASEAGAPSGYGFQVGLEVPKPANGKYFMAGEAIPFRLAFRDGEGHELFHDHKLPTYGEFVRDEIPTGLGYYSSRIDSTVYYALKHREANILVALAGPTDKLRVAKSLLDGNRLMDAEAVTATVAADGFSSVFTGVPSFAISLGPPARLDEPVRDSVTLTVPKDALPGTYIAAVKARRIFGGEALNRAAAVPIQVGTEKPSAYRPATVNCENCHRGDTAFANVLHGVTDRRACFGCHMGLSFEPDNALDVRVHSIHSRSRRFGANAQNCTVCHASQPAGAARGLLAGAGF